MPIETFAAKPLLTVMALHFARGNVVSHGVAKHVLHRVGFLDVGAAHANDHGEFDFPIEFFSDAAVRRHVAVRAVHTQGLLGKKRWMRGHFLHVRARFYALVKVIEIVPADTEHIFAGARNRRMQFYLGQFVMTGFHLGRCLFDRRQPFLTGCYQRNHATGVKRQCDFGRLCGTRDIDNAAISADHTRFGWHTCRFRKGNQFHLLLRSEFSGI